MRRSIHAALGTTLIVLASNGPAQTPPSVPWAVPSDMVVEQRLITWNNGGARLSGTLFFPRGQSHELP